MAQTEEFKLLNISLRLTLKLVAFLTVAILDVTSGGHAIRLKRTADVGETAIFHCPSSAAEPSVSWNLHVGSTDNVTSAQLVSEDDVAHGSAHRFVVGSRGDDGDGDWQLTISDVQTADAGIHECRTSRGALLAEFQLSVPYFRIEVCEGQNARLECRTTLDLHVVWRYSRTFREERSFVYSQGRVLARDRTRYHVHSIHRNYDLVIHNTTVGDSGIFTCTEDGGFGPGEVCWALSVLDKMNNPSCMKHEENNTYRHQDSPDTNQYKIMAASQQHLNASRCTSNIFLVVALLFSCVCCA